MTDQTPAPILTVTWDTAIGTRRDGYDPETGTAYEAPVTLGEMVVAEISDRLTNDIKRDAAQSDYRGAIQTAREAASAAASEEAARLVKEALSGEIQRTNQWGEPRSDGEPQTLRDFIRADVQKFLGEPQRRDRFDERNSGFRELLRKEVEEALRTELRDAIQDARKQVAATVRDRAAEILGDVVKRETR